MKACALACKAATVDNFSGQHGPDGTPWAPLKRESRRKRGRRGRRRGGAQQVLLDTGLLRTMRLHNIERHAVQLTPEDGAKLLQDAIDHGTVHGRH